LANRFGVIRNILLSQWASKGKIPDSGASKKLAGLFIRNFVKLINLVPDPELFCLFASGLSPGGVYEAQGRDYS
jgi:hypothetical protein